MLLSFPNYRVVGGHEGRKGEGERDRPGEGETMGSGVQEQLVFKREKKKRGVGGWRTETGRWRRRVRENEGVYEKTRLIFPERRAE